MQTSNSEVGTSFLSTVFSSSSQFLLFIVPHLLCFVLFSTPSWPQKAACPHPLVWSTFSLFYQLQHLSASSSLTFSPATGKAAGEEGRVSWGLSFMPFEIPGLGYVRPFSLTWSALEQRCTIIRTQALMTSLSQGIAVPNTRHCTTLFTQ